MSMKPSPELIARQIALRAKAAAPIHIPINLNFPKQESFVACMDRYLAAQCTRRAGKSSGLALKFLKTMDKYPGSQCLYIALTRDSARAIMWAVLQEMSDLYGIGCTFLEARLVVKHPNGAVLRLLGADQKNFIRRIKGIKSPGVGIDEAQDFNDDILKSLIEDVLTPCISDYSDGWLACTGTPGAVPKGYFFDITQSGKYGFAVHNWSVLDNPHMPNAQAFIADLKVKRGWDESNPTLQREWRNRWVLDLESLWIRYNEKSNHYTELPIDNYHYILGVDVGFRDADALAVLAYGDKGPTTYLVEELVTAKQGLTELVEQIRHLATKYNIEKMMIDEGGLGKKLAEEMRRRWGVPVQPADKQRKQETVEILNDAMRLKKFMAKSASRFAQDSYLVQIDWEHSTPNKIVIKKNPHSDIIDAVLYAFKESPAYAYEAPVRKPKPGSKEWLDAQSNEMWERELEGLQKEDAYNKRMNGEDEGDY